MTRKERQLVAVLKKMADNSYKLFEMFDESNDPEDKEWSIKYFKQYSSYDTVIRMIKNKELLSQMAFAHDVNLEEVK